MTLAEELFGKVMNVYVCGGCLFDNKVIQVKGEIY